MHRRIVIKFSFPAIHSWPECPFSDVGYLKEPHRHVFHVTMKFDVTHDDREIEFIRKKTEVESDIRQRWANQDLKKMSCEMMAEELAIKYGASFVSVFEDDENGAEVWPEYLSGWWCSFYL